MTHTIEGDNIHFTFISPEGKQRKITLSLSEDGDLINQILSIKDRTSREAALGYLFVNGQQEPRSETQLLSLTDPKQDVLTIQDLQTQVKSIDGLIESLKEKMKEATPEQKKEYENRIKELEKDKKRLQQQADLIKNKTNNRTQSTSTIEQLLMIASNPEPSTIKGQFEDEEQFKEFLEKVKQDLTKLNIDPANKMSNLVQSLQDKLKQMEEIYKNPELKPELKKQELKELQKEIEKLWNEIDSAGKEFNELQQDLREKEKVLNEGVKKVNKIAAFLKQYPASEKITSENFEEQFKFINDNLTDDSVYKNDDFKNKLIKVIDQLNLNELFHTVLKDDTKFDEDTKFNKIPLKAIVPYFFSDTNLTKQFKSIKSWFYIRSSKYDVFKYTYKLNDMPWLYISDFIKKLTNITDGMPITGDMYGLGFNPSSEPLGGFKDLFTSKKVKENIKSNNEDIKSIKTEISDLKEQLKEIKYLIKNQQSNRTSERSEPQQTERKNFQNYLKDIENITMNKLKHVEPNKRQIEEPNEIAKKILDRRVDLMPDYTSDDDEPWDD